MCKVKKVTTRHWSFVVCDPKYLYPMVFILISAGILWSIITHNYTQFNRVGNLIIGIGVWMSLRYTLREGIEKSKNLKDSLPVIQVNSNIGIPNSEFFNKIAYSIGDAKLQLHGFFIVIFGSVISSFGDLILEGACSLLKLHPIT